jgi:hypothetical protein
MPRLSILKGLTAKPLHLSPIVLSLLIFMERTVRRFALNNSTTTYSFKEMLQQLTTHRRSFTAPTHKAEIRAKVVTSPIKTNTHLIAFLIFNILFFLRMFN